MLVEFKISGLPVLDDDKRVVRPEAGRAPRARSAQPGRKQRCRWR